jgi:hypothetical protein
LFSIGLGPGSGIEVTADRKRKNQHRELRDRSTPMGSGQAPDTEKEKSRLEAGATKYRVENKKAPNRVGAQYYPRISLQDHNAFVKDKMN